MPFFSFQHDCASSSWIRWDLFTISPCKQALVVRRRSLRGFGPSFREGYSIRRDLWGWFILTIFLNARSGRRIKKKQILCKTKLVHKTHTKLGGNRALQRT